jgi:hypothetical protein
MAKPRPKKTNGKQWRMQRQARGTLTRIIREEKGVVPARETPDPSLTNKQRMQMKRAARVYREIGNK